MSRAMVFASATLASCGGKSRPAEPPEQHHGGGGCSKPDQAEIDRLEKQRQQAQTEAEKRELDDQIERAKMPVCMPYGAPPARRRVV